MNKSLTFSMLALFFASEAIADDGKKPTANQLGVGLNLNFGHNNSKDINASFTGTGSRNSFNLMPYVNIPLGEKFAVMAGLDYDKYKSTYTNQSGGVSEYSESAIGPCISILRYCDPCYSEEDCLRFFGYTGINFSYTGGNSEDIYTPKGSGVSSRDKGKVNYLHTNALAGFNYRLTENVFLNGQINLFGYYADKGVPDNDNKNNYYTNRGINVLNSVAGGIRVNF